jgi:hypothetical protein
VHLLAMARLSQRALDYSVKGYTLRHSDFSRQIYMAGAEIEQHHHRAKEFYREFTKSGMTNSLDTRFAFAAVSIGNALHATHSAAVRIAQDTLRMLESTGIQGCPALEAMSRHVNAALRVCVVALFEEDAAHARIVLRQTERCRFRELNSIALHPHIGRWAGAQGDFERAVIRSLGDVAKQTHEMADAILFWLEGHLCTAAGAGNVLQSMLQTEPATHLSYLASDRLPTPKVSQGFSC